MSYTDLLPSHSSNYQRALDQVCSSVVDKLKSSNFTINPQDCKKEILPHLAYMYRLNISGMSEQEVRDSISSVFEVKKTAGTPYSLKRVFEALNMKAVTKEWFEYGGEPFHYKVDLSLENKEITLELSMILRNFLNKFSNARSVLDELSLSYIQSQKIGIKSGGVGEVSCNIQMLEGYSETLMGIQKIYIGAVGETSYTAYQI